MAGSGDPAHDGESDAVVGAGGIGLIARAVGVGVLALLVGTIPRNIFWFANLRFVVGFPWAVPVIAFYIWLCWRYMRGDGPPSSTSETRRVNLRANRLPGSVWAWALTAGVVALVTLVVGLRLENRLVRLPEQVMPALDNVPSSTLLALFLLSAPVAGIIEESSFRGYMQRPIERRYGLLLAILITGTMFALVHLDFTPILWPYYMAVAAIYGTVAFLTDSILPAIVLHTAGNTYSNLNLWLNGQAEWQTSSGTSELIWRSGLDSQFWMSVLELAVGLALMIWAYRALARACRAVGLPPRETARLPIPLRGSPE